MKHIVTVLRTIYQAEDYVVDLPDGTDEEAIREAAIEQACNDNWLNHHSNAEYVTENVRPQEEA